MADLTTTSVIDTFMDADTASAAREAIAADPLSPLAEAEIAITNASTALTISRAHVITATTADQTNALPAASACAGMRVEIRISSTSTKFVTIDGNGSETIDGALTLVMRKNESATLFCDGTSWIKIASKFSPITISARDSGGDQSISSFAITTLNLSVAITDEHSNVDLTANTLTIPRSGYWNIYFKPSLYDFSTTSSEVDAAVNINSVDSVERDRRYVGYVGGGTATQCYPTLSATTFLNAGDVIKPTIFTGPASAKTLSGYSVYSVITLREIYS
jgi:hypothetical protein